MTKSADNEARFQPDTMGVALRLPGDDTAPARARRAITDLLPSDDAADVARLCVTEMVTNAVEHADTAEVGFLLVADPGQGLFAAVSDSSHAVPAPPPDPSPNTHLAEGGRGIAMLESLSEDWGVTHTSHGKWVWCRLPAPNPRAAPTRTPAGDRASRRPTARLSHDPRHQFGHGHLQGGLAA